MRAERKTMRKQSIIRAHNPKKHHLYFMEIEKGHIYANYHRGGNFDISTVSIYIIGPSIVGLVTAIREQAYLSVAMQNFMPLLIALSIALSVAMAFWFNKLLNRLGIEGLRAKYPYLKRVKSSDEIKEISDRAQDVFTGSLFIGLIFVAISFIFHHRFWDDNNFVSLAWATMLLIFAVFLLTRVKDSWTFYRRTTKAKNLLSSLKKEQ